MSNSSILVRLFTTPEGYALLAVIAGAMLLIGTKREVVDANFFPVRRTYDFRNKNQVRAQTDQRNDPFYTGITSIKVPIRTRKWH